MRPMSSRSLCISRTLVVVSLALVPAAAHAAQPGVGRGTIMLSAERLFGFSATHTSLDVPGGELNIDQKHFGLALSPTMASTNIYLVPRLALDFALVDGLTLGSAAGFAIGDVGGSRTMTSFVLAPRLGYVLGLSKVVGLWLRGGFTYFNVTIRDDPDDDSVTQWGMSLNLEPTLMISPMGNVHFTVGLVVDVPFAGRQSTETTTGPVTSTTSVRYAVRQIGLLAGLVVSF